MSDQAEMKMETRLEEAQKEVAYYKKLSKEAGDIRLRETEDLSRLIAELKKVERALQESRDELEKRVFERTADLSKVNLLLNQEISERIRAEEQIKTSLKEKEVLLKEVHHRVKNNMQVIISLLNMQSRYFTDTKAIDIFTASMDRIKSMALIHNKLYQSESLSCINISDYVRDLSRSLVSTYSVNAHIELNLDIDPLPLDIDTLMPLGILINELLANSLKHAFPEERSGRIDILLKTEDAQQLILTVSDNGIGIPPGLDYMDTKSMGMQLIITLVEQLEGTIELNRDQGTEFRVTFNVP